MSLRFRRSVRLAPGVRLNFGLRGPSVSVGPRGLGATFGPAGLTTHAGIPGTGLSYRTTTGVHGAPGFMPTSALPPGARPVGGDQYVVSLGLDLDENGYLTMAAADGSPIDPRVERQAREQQADKLHAWLAARCDEINAGFDRLLTLHCGTPRPDFDHKFSPVPFAKTRPDEPAPPAGSAWDRVFPWRKHARDQEHERDLILYRHDLELWEAARAAHDLDFERRRHRTEDERLTSPAVMHELLEEALHAVPWPRETLVRFDIDPSLAALHAEVDLPELEDMPAHQAAIAARGFKLNLHERSEVQVRKAYAAHVHGVVFRVVGVAFATLPTLQSVLCSGFSQRVDPATGKTGDGSAQTLDDIQVRDVAQERVSVS